MGISSAFPRDVFGQMFPRMHSGYSEWLATQHVLDEYAIFPFARATHRLQPDQHEKLDDSEMIQQFILPYEGQKEESSARPHFPLIAVYQHLLWSGLL